MRELTDRHLVPSTNGPLLEPPQQMFYYFHFTLKCSDSYLSVTAGGELAITGQVSLVPDALKPPLSFHLNTVNAYRGVGRKWRVL